MARQAFRRHRHPCECNHTQRNRGLYAGAEEEVVIADDDLNTLIEGLLNLLATATPDQRSRFRYAVEDFQLPLSKVGKQEAERRLRELIVELKEKP